MLEHATNLIHKRSVQKEKKKTMRIKTMMILMLITMILSCKIVEKNIGEKNEIKSNFISVEYPEVYELANIALALTEYGMTDKWQVRKDIEYYDEMRSYFGDYMEHPLLDSINFSREKWQEYLSYRTDSYAFELDENYRLTRKNDFQSFEINTFDRFKKLTENFARKSKFKNFFHQNKNRYDQIVQNYQKEYLLDEMRGFLSDEFGDFFSDKKYSIVISPFVYAQNLHRDIDSTWTADFPSVAKQVIEGIDFENEKDKSTEIHTLFTEMDHGYVNPTSDKHDVSSSFDEDIWDDESGYSNSGNAVFNEYMTWAVFDIFNKIHFPEIAEKVNLNWHFQNDTRGFPYSNLFANELVKRYELYKGEKNIKDLYTEILEWTNEIQPTLSKPLLLNDSDTIQISNERQLIELRFSEPMKKVQNFDFVFQYSQWDSEAIRVGEENSLKWDKEGMLLTFEVKLPDKPEYYLLLNWWGVEKPLISEKGILLQATSGFIIKGNSAQNKG